MTDQPIAVAALYRFTPFADLPHLRERVHAALAALGVQGTILLAPEGINGTIAATPERMEAALAALRDLPGCADLPVKRSGAETMPFHRLKVRIKREIVTMGEPDADPSKAVGDYVAPADWNRLIDDPATVVIDTRNAYEVRVGTFANAIDPGTDSFRDFPGWFRRNRDALLAPGAKVAMFCTGGIRCEKATALLRNEGVEQLYHLDGGILRYLEEVRQADSRWQGECFVFDERVAVGHGLAAGTHALCRGCRMPVSEADRASPLFQEGVACPACHDTRDAVRRAGYAERHRQTQLADARGERHVGARFGESERPCGSDGNRAPAKAGVQGTRGGA